MTIPFARCIALSVLVAACSSSSSPDVDTGTFPRAPYAIFTSDDQRLDLELRTAPTQPPVRGEIAAAIRIRRRSDGAPVDGIMLDVTPWMVAHGHGASGERLVTPLGGGEYRVDGLRLSMAGQWELRLSLEAEGVSSRATSTIAVR